MASEHSGHEPAATVVGGGIAGLASAIGLARAGWRTVVLERAPELRELGAGLALPRNGAAALHGLGLDDDAVAALGHETVGTGFQDRTGRWLLRIRGERPDVRWATTVRGVHRRRLHTALLAAARAAGVDVVTGADLLHLHPGTADGERAELVWRRGEDERTDRPDLVVGADGVRSTVRTLLFPGVRARYSGSTSWRAVVTDTTSDGRLVELWGPGGELGAMRISDDEVYWYGYVRHPAGAAFPDEHAAVLRRFAGWAPRLVRLVEATDPGRLMRHDVHHLPGGLPTFVRGRAVLVGDAAHAALPTMGQGAATALEDGATLGPLVGAPVAAGGRLAPAVAAFDATRRPRTRAIARQAVVMARIGADLPGGVRQTVRDAALRLVPPAAVARAGSSIVRWVPPPPAAPVR